MYSNIRYLVKVIIIDLLLAKYLQTILLGTGYLSFIVVPR